MNYLRLLKSTLREEPTGFNLLEILFASILLATIAAIGIPNLFKTIQLQYLKGANSEIYQTISQAKSRSLQRKEDWQVSFRTNSGIVQHAYHRASENPATSTAITWNSLPKEIQINSETDIPQTNSIHQLCFNAQGLPTTIQTGPPRGCTTPPTFTPVQITLNNSTTLPYKRCVAVSTLLGAIKTGQDQSYPQNGKNCY